MLVTVEATFDDAPLDAPDNRPRYAAIATPTAAKASEARHCAARLGKPVDRLAPPVRADEYGPLRTADGTCAGISTGRGATTAVETARDHAPHEECRLATADGRQLYGLAADFGPYAHRRPERREEYEDDKDLPSAERPVQRPGRERTFSWTTAECPDGPGLFTLHAEDGDKEEGRDDGDKARRRPASAPQFERAALKAFAARAARAHGCSEPVGL